MQNNISKEVTTVTVNSSATLTRPALSIKFTIGRDGDYNYIDSAYLTMTNRDQTGLKEYPLEDVCSFLYYNKSKQVASILFTTKEISEDENTIDEWIESTAKKENEILKTLETLKDEPAIEAFKFVAYYWLSLESGFQVTSGECSLVSSELLEDIEDEDAQEET